MVSRVVVSLRSGTQGAVSITQAHMISERRCADLEMWSRLMMRSAALRRRKVPMQPLIVLLCIVSGSLDAITFFTLGDVFASVMTGNIVIVGVAAGTMDGQLALACGVAIAGYIFGLVIGAWLIERWQQPAESGIWPRRVSYLLTIQLGLLTVMNGIWIASGSHPSEVLQLTLLPMAACAMGMQGIAVRRIRLPVSTTYMTGALTTLFDAAASKRSFSHSERNAFWGLPALCLGAFIGSVILAQFRYLAFVIPTAAVATVAILSWVMDVETNEV